MHTLGSSGNRRDSEIVQTNMNRLHALAVLPAALLLVTGCGGSDAGPSDSLPAVSEPAVSEPVASNPMASDPVADELSADAVVFVWVETGGCMQGGPNCARYAVTVDGTVSTTRAGLDVAAEPEAVGQLDPALVQAWRDALDGVDLDALRERVGEGELTAAFDGVDYEVSNPVAGVELSSVETAFDESEPVFATAVALAAAAREAAPLELQMR